MSFYVVFNVFNIIFKMCLFLIFSGTDDQLICLKMTLQLIPSLHVENVIILIKIIASISYQHNNDHRKLIYDIMCSTYKVYL